MEEKNERSEFDKVMADILVYSHPEYFLPSYTIGLKRGKRFSLKNIEKYWIIFTTINWFIKKISKYELYFIDFYPVQEKISMYDALDHHIHAYLEDMETLKNKLVVFITNLKNDLKKIAVNKKEIDYAFKKLAEKVISVFKCSQQRGEHRHGNFMFVDAHTTEGKMAEILLVQENFRNTLTQHGLEKLQKMKQDSLNQGKEWWSKNASNNYKQLCELVDEVVKRNKKFLYEFLDIEPIASKE